MILIKKLDLYLLKRFLVLFMMTFLIVIFILLMQFLWKHFADLAGKGVGWGVFAEFFGYASVTLVPLALPLALLLASLMTFGNLGENFELNAMKSSGISLFRIMRPLAIFIAAVSVSAFFFSNLVLPMAQTKLWTLVISLKQKSPELDIPVGEFYKGIDGVNLYVRDKEGDLLKNMMIYDFSSGFSNAVVLVADSGRIKISEDKKYLMLTLYDGESFENLKKQRQSTMLGNIPYRRETFGVKEILFEFDSNFKRLDDKTLEDQHVSKNIVQLAASIDSVNQIISARSVSHAKELLKHHYFARERFPDEKIEDILLKKDSLRKEHSVKTPHSQMDMKYDSIYASFTSADKKTTLESAIQKAKNMMDQVDYQNIMLGSEIKYVKRHESEWHRKFTLSFACLIFFFIGAPLGSIIRKGGFGAPVVISVLMFIVYYIIDNTGYKMAREGLWDAYQGMWLSSSVLLPIGVFLSYKAAVDANLFNPESYAIFMKKMKNKIFKTLKISSVNN